MIVCRRLQALALKGRTVRNSHRPHVKILQDLEVTAECFREFWA